MSKYSQSFTYQCQHRGNQGDASPMCLIPSEASQTDMQTWENIHIFPALSPSSYFQFTSCGVDNPSNPRTTDAAWLAYSSGHHDSCTSADPPKPLWRSQETHGIFRRHKKAIWTQEETVSWYFSRSVEQIDIPPSSANNYSHALTSCDLFIHCHQSGIQTWLWEGLWTPIKEGHPHPCIEGYCLSILHGSESSWVTRKTRTTYALKKRRSEM